MYMLSFNMNKPQVNGVSICVIEKYKIEHVCVAKNWNIWWQLTKFNWELHSHIISMDSTQNFVNPYNI
jgi:hypothetical protein